MLLTGHPALPQVRPEAGDVGPASRSRDDDGTDAIAQDRVRRVHPRDVGDVVLREEQVLDLTAAELLTAPHDHILDAAEDRDGATRLEPGQIAGAEEAIGG